MNIVIIIGIILITILFLFSYSACVISSRYSRMEEDEMSIFQEYEENEKIIGAGRTRAIEEYIKYSTEKGHPVLYSDVVYKNEEYELFDKWFEKAIQPFLISNYDEVSKYSVTLDQDDYWYDWLQEIKTKDNRYGDGHCYEEIFNSYLESKFHQLNQKLNYDSENGMFCVYCEDIKDAEEVAYELSCLYKNESKMIELIKKAKETNPYLYSDIKI